MRSLQRGEFRKARHQYNQMLLTHKILLMIVVCVCCRNGRNAKLTVRTDKEPNDVAEGESQGTFTLLDFTMRDTRFYIGGVPQHAGVGPHRQHLLSCAVSQYCYYIVHTCMI